MNRNKRIWNNLPSPKFLWSILFICGFILLIIIYFIPRKDLKIYKMTGAAQGTYYAITYCAENNDNLQPEVEDLLKKVDLSVSSYLPNWLLQIL